MQGEGTQNYKCKLNEEGHYKWKLQFPLVKLWFYDECGNFDTSGHPDGMHWFANIGSGAGWDIRTNCDAGTDHDSCSCQSYTAQWHGKAPKVDPQEKAIAWLLVEKDEDNMSPVEQHDEFYNNFWN
jgi:hypothetical protein